MSEQDVVWVGSYGDEESRSYTCVRWTAEECMKAMQEDHDRTRDTKNTIAGRLEFVPNPLTGMDREYVGYAPEPHPRWESDISYYRDDGQFVSQFVYIEPFVLPSARTRSGQ